MAFGSDDQEVEITFTAKTEGIDQASNKVDESLGNIQRKAEQASSSFRGFFTELNQTRQFIGQSFQDLSNIIGGAFDAISRGAAIDDITSSFERLSAQAGVAGDSLITKFSAALGDTIPKVDLMKQANELLVGGLDPNQFELVASAARSLGEATGGSAAEGLNALGDSLLRGNDRALKNLGIVVDNTKALDDYAKKLGTVKEALTEEGRVQAIREATIQKLIESQERLGKVEDDAADKIDQIKSALQNQRDAALLALASNEGLNTALGGLAKIVKSIDFKPIIAGISSIATLSVNAVAGIASLVRQLDLYQARLNAAKEAQKNEGFFESIFGGDTQKNAADAAGILELIRTPAQNLGAAFSDLLTPVNKVNDALKTGTKVGDDAIETYDRMIDKLKADELAQKAAEQATKAHAEALKQAESAAKKQAEAIEKLNDAMSKHDDAYQDAFQKDADKIKAEAEAFNNQLQQIGANFISSIFSGDFSDASLKDSLKGLGGETGQFFGEKYGGPIGGAIGGAIGDALGKGVFDALDHVFSGREAQGAVRDSLDRLFADALKDNPLQAIIEGQLSTISDLNFMRDGSAFADGTFDDLFATLPAQAQEAFSGIAAGFSALFETGQIQAGQLAAVLSNNLGGSLNNLQLLVQSTGQSFEQMREGVVEAFLDGELSALQAQTALNGIAQIAQKGIPDGIGLTVQAFDNLKAAGSKGGRAVVDALGDIGAEAEELGIDTFPELIQNLVATGKYSAAEIQQVFDALAAAGIDTVEELTNATAEQLLPVLSQLEAQGFLTEQAQQAKDFAEAINNIPDEKTVVFNFKGNFDNSATKTAIETAAGRSVGPGEVSA